MLVDPEKTIRKLCYFAELDFVDEMLDPKEGQTSSLTGKKAKGFKKERGTRWQKTISNFDKTIITLLTRKSMKNFEYDPDNHPIYLHN